MANFANFIGGSAPSRALQADAERSINFYVEAIDSPTGTTKSAKILLSKPGLKLFCGLPNATSVQGLIESNGRAFAVAGGQLYELSANGAYTPRGSVGQAATQAATRLCASQTQVLIVTSGAGYLFDLASNTLSAITAAGWPTGATAIAMIDGYFIALEPSSQVFAISGLNDGASWDALDFGDAEGEQGNVVGLIADHRQLWLMADTHAEVYYDSGNANFPFSRLEGAFMEQGLGALASLVNFDNAIAWLGQNRDGAAILWRANGYTPQRISTHAFEARVATYPTIADAVGYTYQEGGHTVLHLDFPSANGGRGETWCYDAATGLLHERAFWNAAEGRYYSDLARTHCYCFGQHLVGDWRSGNVYVQSMAYATDNGAAIRRLRAAPALSRGGKFDFFKELRLLAQVGVGTEPLG